MKYHFKIHTEKQGFTAVCMELSGCQTQADDRRQLLENMEEALNLYLSEPFSSGHIFPAPRREASGRNIVSVGVYPSVAFANRLREMRLRCKLTQMEMKARLGIKNLSNYQRLEDPSRANPEWKTLFLIKKQFPKFKVEDLLSV